jgi:trimethylamine--corrinoid protein Co-methyltransferase
MKSTWLPIRLIKLDQVGTLIDDLTLKYFKTERYFPKLLLRDTRSTWETKGGKSFRERARERVKIILDSHESNPLHADVASELSKLVKTSETLVAS